MKLRWPVDSWLDILCFLVTRDHLIDDNWVCRYLLPHQEMMLLYMSSGRIEYLGRLPDDRVDFASDIVSRAGQRWTTAAARSCVCLISLLRTAVETIDTALS